jgi:hypothetical protein
MQCDLRWFRQDELDKIFAALDFVDRRFGNKYKMTTSGTPAPTDALFSEGDEVVLAKGPYTGTPRGFSAVPRADIEWAEITERNGTIRSHPLEWLAHTAIGS